MLPEVKPDGCLQLPKASIDEGGNLDSVLIGGNYVGNGVNFELVKCFCTCCRIWATVVPTRATLVLGIPTVNLLLTVVT